MLSVTAVNASAADVREAPATYKFQSSSLKTSCGMVWLSGRAFTNTTTGFKHFDNSRDCSSMVPVFTAVRIRLRRLMSASVSALCHTSQHLLPVAKQSPRQLSTAHWEESWDNRLDEFRALCPCCSKKLWSPKALRRPEWFEKDISTGTSSTKSIFFQNFTKTHWLGGTVPPIKTHPYLGLNLSSSCVTIPIKNVKIKKKGWRMELLDISAQHSFSVPGHQLGFGQTSTSSNQNRAKEENHEFQVSSKKGLVQLSWDTLVHQYAWHRIPESMRCYFDWLTTLANIQGV